MLNEYKLIYKEKADIIPNWKNIRRSDLAFKYVEFKDIDKNLAEAYLSALIYKFWNVIEHNYHKQSIKYATPEDCYQWVIDGIMYVLDKHVWTNPESSLYGDKDAPEKAINIFIVHAKDRFFNAKNTNKRKLNYEVSSIEYMQEECPWLLTAKTYDSVDVMNDFIDNKVIYFFNQKMDIAAFALDVILNVDSMFDLENIDGKIYSKFNRQRLKRYLRHLPEEYKIMFSERYNIELSKVEKSVAYMYNVSYETMDNAVDNFFNELRVDREFMKLLRGAC